MQITQLDKDHNFGYDADSAIRGGLERNIVDGTGAVAPFDWKKDLQWHSVLHQYESP